MKTRAALSSEDRQGLRDDLTATYEALTSKEEIGKLVLALVDSGLPPDAMSELFLLKVLLNSHLYHGWGTLTDVVRGTKRQGLMPREFGKRMKARAKNGERTGHSARPNTDRPGSESTEGFRLAANTLKMGLGVTDIRDRTFIPTLHRGANVWKSLMPDQNGRGRLDPVAILRTALDEQIRVAGQGALSLVPVDRCVAMMFAMRPYKEAMEALAKASEFVRMNLAMRAAENCQTVGESRLPVGREFARSALRAGFKPYSEHYYARHKFQVWNAMLDSFNLTLSGRDVDRQGVAGDFLGAMCGMVGGETGEKLRRWNRCGLRCALRDDDSDAFGYRTCVFGVYDALAARDVAVAAAPARAESTRSHGNALQATLTLMRKDFPILGASMSDDVAPERMHKFAMFFGKWLIW